MKIIDKSSSLVSEKWSQRIRRGIWLDIEATGLHDGSYPIEIGFAHIHTDAAGNDSVRSWSYLIKPHERWDIDAQWNPESEKIHKIPRADLAFGEPVTRVVSDLQKVLQDHSCIFSDAPDYECKWLEPAVIAGASSAQVCYSILGDLTFSIVHSFYEGVADVKDDILMPVMNYLTMTAPNHTPHRAGPDAELAALQALGLLRHLEAGTIHQFEDYEYEYV